MPSLVCINAGLVKVRATQCESGNTDGEQSSGCSHKLPKREGLTVLPLRSCCMPFLVLHQPIDDRPRVLFTPNGPLNPRRVIVLAPGRDPSRMLARVLLAHRGASCCITKKKLELAWCEALHHRVIFVGRSRRRPLSHLPVLALQQDQDGEQPRKRSVANRWQGADFVRVRGEMTGLWADWIRRVFVGNDALKRWEAVHRWVGVSAAGRSVAYCCWDVRASSGARWMKFRHSFYTNACTWLMARGRVMAAPEFVELHDCI
jgi:hypothetical protein